LGAPPNPADAAAAAEVEGDAAADRGDDCAAGEAYERAVSSAEQALRREVEAVNRAVGELQAALARGDYQAAANAAAAVGTAAGRAGAAMQVLEGLRDKAAAALYKCGSAALERGELERALDLFSRARALARGRLKQKAGAAEAAARELYKQFEREQNELVKPGR
jgi:hypothetical protein